VAEAVFICHASPNKGVAEQLAAALEAAGTQCWIAPRDVVAGRPYAQQIVEAIRSARALVLLLSPAANDSPHVDRELERATSLSVPIFPICIEPVLPSPALEYYISSTHWLDVSGAPFEAQLQHVVGEIAASLSPGSAPTSVGSAPESQDWTPPLPPLLIRDSEAELVGRANEREALRRAWRDAEAGTRQIVLLAGPSGSGRSALLAELAAELHARGAAVLHGGSAAASRSPCAPFAEAVAGYAAAAPTALLERQLGPQGGDLAELVPYLGERVPSLGPTPGLDPEARAQRIADATAELLAGIAEQRPTLLILEDIERADDETLRLLCQIAASEAPRRLLVAASYRERDLEPSRSLSRALLDLERQRNVVSIALAGLDAAAVARLVGRDRGRLAWLAADEEPRFAALLCEETGGSPRLIEEVLGHLQVTGTDLSRALEDDAGLAALDLPRAILERASARLRALDDDARALLASAALIGREFPVDVLLAVGFADRAEFALAVVADAEDRGLLEPVLARAHYRFARSIERAALIEALPASQHGALHQLIGRALEARHGSPAAQLSHHFAQAVSLGEGERAARYARTAAAEALEAHRYAEAATQLQRALDLDPTAEAAMRCDLRTRLGIAQARGGDPRGHATLHRAVQEARGLGDAGRLAEAALACATRLDPRAEASDWLGALLEEALSELADAPSSLRARLLAARSQRCSAMGEVERADALWMDALALALELRDSESLLAVVRSHGGAASADAALWAKSADELCRLAASQDDPALEARCLEWRHECAIANGDPQAAAAAESALASLAARSETGPPRASLSRARLLRARLEGDLERIEAACREPEREASSAASFARIARRIALHARRGSVDRVAPELAKWPEAQPASPSNRLLRAMLQVETGALSQAREALDELVALDSGRLPGDADSLAYLLALAQLLLRFEDGPADDAGLSGQRQVLEQPLLARDLAREAHEQRIPERRAEAFGDAPLVPRLRERLRLQDRTEQHLRDAIALAGAAGAAPDRVEAELALTEMLEHRAYPGDRERGQATARDVLARADTRGLEPFAQRARALVDRLERADTRA